MSEEIQTSEEDMSQIDFEKVVDDLMSGKTTLADMRGFSEEEIEAIYSLAYNIFENGKYEDALKIFQFLCLFSHLDERFWLGAGACYQQLKEFEKAVEAYSMVAMMDVENPIPPLQAAMCYLSMEDFDKAESGCEAAIHWSGDKDEHATTKARADALLSAVREQRETAHG